MNPKRNCVMLANGHPPFDTRIFVKEACTLAKAGYHVSIILPHHQDEYRDGVRILSVTPIQSGFQKLFISPWNIFMKAVRQPSQSIYHIHDSNILHIGILLKLMGRTVIYDAHEDTPLQISYQHWIPKLLRKPYAWFYYVVEKLCGWMFDSIIVAEPVISKYFPASKTHLIRNFPYVDYFRAHPAIDYERRNRRLTCLGTLTKARGLYEMLEGAKQASKSVEFEFMLGGKFSPPQLEDHVRSTYTIKFMEWLTYPQVVDVLFDSQVGIIIPNPNERYKTNYPVKLFEFMAAGLPVIASREGESTQFITECDGGLLIDPLNIDEVSNAIVWLFQHPEDAKAMGKRGQELIFSTYNWEKESEVLLRVYEKLT